MASLREVRSRIGGVQKTQKITRAMKMVAASKLRRAQIAIVAARPYARKTAELLQDLASTVGESADPLLTPREVRSVALIVVTSDRGFCGGFNSNLIRVAVSHIETAYPGLNEQKRAHLLCIGKKGVDYFSRRAFTIAARYAGFFSGMTFGSVQEVVRTVIEGYRRGEYDRVEIVFNEFKNVARSRIVVEPFLPIPREAAGEAGTKPHRATNYIYEPSREAILADLLPRHLNFQLWRALLESRAAEEGARMAAMENATVNANEMIATLQLQYNKARQALITKELLEIVGGAEALRQG